MKRYFFYLVMIILVAQSCVKEVDFSFEEDTEKLVVNCIFSPNSPLQVFVTKSRMATDSLNYPAVRDAQVTISQDNRQTYDLIKFTLPAEAGSIGYYSAENASYLTEKNVTRLSVKHPKITSIEAQSNIPAPALHNYNFQLISFEKVREERELVSFNLQCKLDIMFNELDLSIPYIAIKMSYNTDYIRYFEPKTLSIEFKDTTIQNTLSFGARSQLYDYYFLNAEIFNAENIRQGNQSLSFYIDNILLFKDIDRFDKKLYLEIYSISEDFYNYIQTYRQQQESLKDPFGEPVAVYNNIKNGYGIFAGYNICVDTIIIQ